MTLALVADLGGRHPAGAGVDVGGAVLLTRVVQVAGLGGVQTVVLLREGRLDCRERRDARQIVSKILRTDPACLKRNRLLEDKKRRFVLLHCNEAQLEFQQRIQILNSNFFQFYFFVLL